MAEWIILVGQNPWNTCGGKEEKSKEAATNRNHCVLNANTSNPPPLPFFVPLKAPSVTCRDTNGVGGVSD